MDSILMGSSPTDGANLGVGAGVGAGGFGGQDDGVKQGREKKSEEDTEHKVEGGEGEAEEGNVSSILKAREDLKHGNIESENIS